MAYGNQPFKLEDFKRYYCIKKDFPKYVVDVINKDDLTFLDKALLHAIDATCDWKYKTIPNPPGGMKHLHGKTERAYDTAIRKLILRLKHDKGVNIERMLPSSVKLFRVKRVKTLVRRIFGNPSQFKYRHIMAFLKYYTDLENDSTYISELLNPVTWISYNGFTFKLVFAEGKYYMDKLVTATILHKDMGKVHIYEVKDLAYGKTYPFMVNADYLYVTYRDGETLRKSIISQGGLKLHYGTYEAFFDYHRKREITLTKIQEYVYLHCRKYDGFNRFGLRKVLMMFINNRLQSRVANWKEEEHLKAIKILEDEYDILLKHIINKHVPKKYKS